MNRKQLEAQLQAAVQDICEAEDAELSAELLSAVCVLLDAAEANAEDTLLELNALYYAAAKKIHLFYMKNGEELLALETQTDEAAQLKKTIETMNDWFDADSHALRAIAEEKNIPLADDVRKRIHTQLEQAEHQLKILDDLLKQCVPTAIDAAQQAEKKAKKV